MQTTNPRRGSLSVRLAAPVTALAIFTVALGATLIALGGALARPAASADGDPDLSRFLDLEKLAQRVEREGFRRLAFEPVSPGLPPETLLLAPAGNDVEKEKALRTAWIATYGDIGKDLEERAKAAAKGKKGAGAQDAAKLYAAAKARIDEVRALAQKPAEKEAFAQRDAALKKFLKRYDFGPRIAKASARGTAVIDVGLAPDTYEVVRRTVYSWKFQALKDASGAEVKIGTKRIEFTDTLAQGELKEALKMLPGEMFHVRYAKMQDEKEVDVLRVTGAKLVLGLYFFVEHEDRLVVAREGVK